MIVPPIKDHWSSSTARPCAIFFIHLKVNCKISKSNRVGWSRTGRGKKIDHLHVHSPRVRQRTIICSYLHFFAETNVARDGRQATHARRRMISIAAVLLPAFLPAGAFFGFVFHTLSPPYVVFFFSFFFCHRGGIKR